MVEGKTKSTPEPSKISSPSNRIYLKHRPPRSANDITDNDTKKFDSDASVEEIIELLQNFSFDEAKQLKLTRIENIKLKEKLTTAENLLKELQKQNDQLKKDLRFSKITNEQKGEYIKTLIDYIG
ncbi:hypothetical protein CRE_21572 [Caenorhabditis remanei]|uniref:Uncharacterized protein n=1 Tax=Caenorhabditis remanei TaxID=31234 RepID=E3NFP7_CAERE|nr:hypothetical protein CRE_21572 [Caenorhabditis remanei]